MRDADIQAHNDLSSMLVMRPQERGKPRRCNLLLSQHSMQAQIVDLELKGNTPVIPKVFVAVDCGKSRSCQDYGRRRDCERARKCLFRRYDIPRCIPPTNNFDSYSWIPQQQGSKNIEIHFVENGEDPTGLGEPLFPPGFAAVANALYKATGKRV